MYQTCRWKFSLTLVVHGLKRSDSKVNYTIIVPEAQLRFSLLVPGKYCYAKVVTSHAGNHNISSKPAQGFPMLLCEMKGKIFLIGK